MGWPSVTIVTTQIDAGTDDPSQARAQILQMAQNVNDIMNSRGAISGIASLDGSGFVPTTQLPVVPATKGGTGQSAFAVGDLLIGGATNTLTKLAAAASGLVLKSNGAGNAPSWQAEGGGFPSGTRMLFQQTNAPTGWTKVTDTAYNNVGLRIVTGSVSSGGADDFTTVFGSSKTTDAHTLTTGQIPAHSHPQRYYSTGNDGNGKTPGINSTTATVIATATLSTGSNSGGGGSHSHGLSGFDLKYIDFILAQKD